MSILRSVALKCPTLKVVADNKAPFEIQLPFYVNKVIESVNMQEPAFEANWKQITDSSPDNFQKLDAILKNPSPPGTPV